MVTEAEAKEIVRRIGEPTRAFASSIVAPLYWVVRNNDGTGYTHNGTAFFLQTESALFGVTAAHVIEGSKSWREHCETHGKTPLRLSGTSGTSVPFDWDDRKIDISSEIDVATFRISEREISHINRTAYRGLQSSWPPKAPVERQGIVYAGFPGIETRQLSREDVEFGIVCGMGIITAANVRVLSSQIEREHLIPDGQGIPPENYNFGGISGAPMIYLMTTTSGLLINALGGVIYSGPSCSDDVNKSIPGFEVIRARPARFINADGTLRHSVWELPDWEIQ